MQPEHCAAASRASKRSHPVQIPLAIQEKTSGIRIRSRSPIFGKDVDRLGRPRVASRSQLKNGAIDCTVQAEVGMGRAKEVPVRIDGYRSARLSTERVVK